MAIQKLQRFSRPFAVLVLTAMFVLPAQAQEQEATSSTPEASPGASQVVDAGPSFVIRPAEGVDSDYFTLEAEAGSVTELTVVLGNADDEAIELRTYASDAVPTTNGGFAIAEEGADVSGTSTWIDYPAETFTFEPGAGIERTFTVTIPPDTEPGQYIAGLALQTPDPIAVEGSAMFNQIIRKAIAVFIIVPGPEDPAFELAEPALDTSGRAPHINIPVTNSGNVLVKPFGTLTLTDATGTAVFEAPISMGSVYAGTTVPLSVRLNTDLADGDYSLAVNLSDQATGTTASIENGTISIAAVEETTSDFNLEGTVSLQPDTANPVFADVSATIVNSGAEVVNSRILLDVSKDGNLVETFPLVPSLTLPQGETSVSQRYIPPTGWEAGSWTFTLRVEVVDAMTGAATNVAMLDSIPPVVVGG